VRPDPVEDPTPVNGIAWTADDANTAKFHMCTVCHRSRALFYSDNGFPVCNTHRDVSDRHKDEEMSGFGDGGPLPAYREGLPKEPYR